ncbi:MAG: hypothetical protein PHF97_05540 [Bacteroidales bacterium]|nr:hypothetical protein [Bacteroidales bacterium]
MPVNIKKLLSIFWLLVICITLSAQNSDFLSKKEFLAEKKKIMEPASELKKMTSTQKEVNDSDISRKFTEIEGLKSNH